MPWCVRLSLTSAGLTITVDSSFYFLYNLLSHHLNNSEFLRRFFHFHRHELCCGRFDSYQLVHVSNANQVDRIKQQPQSGVCYRIWDRFERQQPNHLMAQTGALEGDNLVEVIASKENNASEAGGKRKHEGDEPERSGRARRRGGGGKKLRPGERYVPPPQKRNSGVSFNKEHFDETSYYFEGGLRKVHPYYFDFKTYCKGRWIGKTLYEVFKSEFRAESIDYYQRAAKEGRIRLNEAPVEDFTTVVLKNNDHLRNTVHRHEPPVVGTPIKVLVDNGEVLVVDKPASIPVHPCGRFRHNTVIFILGKERGISELHTVHRLDRLTSGVLLFARTLEISKKLDQLVRDRQLEKEYVCRVDGKFPEDELVCEEPILVVSFKVGVCRVDPKGKECRTIFQRLSYNGSTSVVRCLPLTGRTHQIRVHLQYLGFPIVNDPIYGSSAWGPHRGKGGMVGKSDEDLLKALVEDHKSKESLHLLDIPEDAIGVLQPEGNSGAQAAEKEEETDGASKTEEIGDKLQTEICGASKKTNAQGQQDMASSTSNTSLNEVSQGTSSTETNPTNLNIGLPTESQCLVPTESHQNQKGATNTSQHISQASRDHLCSECKIVRPDPIEKELVMYLHALRYKGPDFEYSTHLPDWAKEDWSEVD